ncbi:hypothetical protein ACGF3C_08515 [Micromonospora sp. NPDC047762]|uniref:hypothetical protein n=1 Tax=unclassified Micromonospora TaxID=2617518 RepID=UPI0033E0FFB8
MKRMMGRAAGASVLGIAFVLAAVPGVAQAATTKCAYDGYDRACATNNDNNSSTIEVCDNEDDGRTVIGLFRRTDGQDVSVTDWNYGGGCRSFPDSKIASFVLKENGGSYGARVYM